MAKIFEITDDIRQIAADAIDDLIDQLGKQCRLVYTAFIPCDCVDGGNHGLGGGPIPIDNTLGCPFCRDTPGKKAVEITEDIILLCNWDVKYFKSIPEIRILLEQGETIVQTKGYLTDMHKIMRAEYIIIQVPLMGLIKYKFKRISEPCDTNNIVQERYFKCFWKRAN